MEGLDVMKNMKRILFRLCYVTLFLALLLAPLTFSAVAAEKVERDATSTSSKSEDGDGSGEKPNEGDNSSGSGETEKPGGSSENEKPGGSSSENEPTPQKKPVTGIRLDTSSKLLEPRGTDAVRTVLLKPIIIPNDATDRTVKWIVPDNPDVI